MAAVTVVRQSAENVIGNRRLVQYVISCAATGDTLATGLKIRNVQVSPTPTVGTAVGAAYTAGSKTITFNYAGGGAAANIDVWVIGF